MSIFSSPQAAYERQCIDSVCKAVEESKRNACPDCSSRESMKFERVYQDSLSQQGLVRAVCSVCGWRTNLHENTTKCKAEWISANAS